ncbi:MAG: hypothetical protein ACO1QB_09460 [Verrucomicrobiales bacterium]
MGNRPTRLSKLFLWSGGIILGLSFISGLLLCIAESIRQDTSKMPEWQTAWRIGHGVLTPLICIFFGYLWVLHIPGGWKMRANHVSGIIVMLNLIILILSSIALYYVQAREVYYWIHGITGLILPLTLGAHIYWSRRWVKNLERN